MLRQHAFQVSADVKGGGEMHAADCRKMAKALILGQIMSIALCFTGVASELLARRGYSAPVRQTADYLFIRKKET